MCVPSCLAHLRAVAWGMQPICEGHGVRIPWHAVRLREKEPRTLQECEGTAQQLLKVVPKLCSHHGHQPSTPTRAFSSCIKRVRHETGLVFLASVDFLPAAALYQGIWQAHSSSLRTTQPLCAPLLPHASSECSCCRLPRPTGMRETATLTGCYGVATYSSISLEDLLNSLPAHTWQSSAMQPSLYSTSKAPRWFKLTYPDLPIRASSKDPDMQVKRVCLSFCCSNDDRSVGFLGRVPRDLEVDSEMWPCISPLQPF